MLFTAGEQEARRGNPARADDEQPRTFTRQIDCEPQPRPAAHQPPARGGTPRDRDVWERSRPGRDN